MNRLYLLIKKIGILAVSVLMVASCGITKPVVVRDSTNIIINYKDSINFIDSLIEVPVYKEYYKDYADMLDTLNLETSLASAKAYLDTANKKLNGEIRNKDTSIPYQIKWKERIVYKDSIVYQKEEIPVPVEVVKTKHPKYEWILWLWGILSLLGLAAFIYLKFFI